MTIVISYQEQLKFIYHIFTNYTNWK